MCVCVCNVHVVCAIGFLPFGSSGFWRQPYPVESRVRFAAGPTSGVRQRWQGHVLRHGRQHGGRAHVLLVLKRRLRRHAENVGRLSKLRRRPRRLVDGHGPVRIERYRRNCSRHRYTGTVTVVIAVHRVVGGAVRVAITGHHFL